MDKALERLRGQVMIPLVWVLRYVELTRPDVLPARVQQCLWANMYSGSVLPSDLPQRT